MFDKDVMQSIDESVLCWLASADGEGNPSVSPKEVFSAWGDSELIIANIASPNTIRNLKTNSSVCVSFVHVFKQKGFKIYGTAEYLKESDQGYQPRHEVLKPMVGEAFNIIGIIKITATKVQPIVAPSYRFFPETTEEAQIESARKTYGV